MAENTLYPRSTHAMAQTRRDLAPDHRPDSRCLPGHARGVAGQLPLCQYTVPDAQADNDDPRLAFQRTVLYGRLIGLLSEAWRADF